MAETVNHKITEEVKEYYSQTLRTSGDLKTSACTIKDSADQRKKVAAVMKLVHEKVKEKYYGCGLVAPDVLKDQYILDLGCGSGMDCYILAKMVGENGHVTGVDMTEEQLAVAREYIEYHRDIFGFKKANTEFKNGYIEELKGAGVEDETQNIIISNCVVNLSPDKNAVLSEAYRVLKPGGELYFSDVYCDKTIPDDLRKHKVLWGECISGALKWTDLHDLAKEVGFSTPVLFESTEMTIDHPELEQLMSGYKFVSATYRMFKLEEATTNGSVDITYKGGIDLQENEFKFAINTSFKKGCGVNVPSEVASMLMESRFAPYFKFGELKKAESNIPLVLDPFAGGVMAANTGGCCGATAQPQKCC